MSTELKSCPFCGGIAFIAQIGTAWRSCLVECEDCGTRHESGDEGNWCGTSWNRRAHRPPAVVPAVADHMEDARAMVDGVVVPSELLRETLWALTAANHDFANDIKRVAVTIIQLRALLDREGE